MRQCSGLLVVGAYRDAELMCTSELAVLLHKLERGGRSLR
jgi:hypothetical protein